MTEKHTRDHNKNGKILSTLDLQQYLFVTGRIMSSNFNHRQIR
jgi:hypothetical protein